MNNRIPSFGLRQRGVATLLTSLMVLFVMTLITLYATQSTVMETSVSANQYRSDQSYAAASGAMDYAEARFASVGVDSDGGGVADCTQASPCNFNIANPAASQTLAARYFYCDPEQLDPTGTGALLTAAQVMASSTTCSTTNAQAILGAKGGRYENQVGIVAQGFSDDNTAQRMMIKAAAVAKSVDDGPGAPLSNGGAVGLSGNMRVVNRFKDFTIWSGKDVGHKGSADTFTADGSLANGVCDRNYPNYKENPNGTNAEIASKTNAQVQADCVQVSGTGNSSSFTNAKLTTNKTREANFDIIDNDPNLDKLIPNPDTVGAYDENDAFWKNFMLKSKAEVIDDANKVGQYYATSTTLSATKTGTIWVNGTATISADQGIYTSTEKKSVLIVATNGVRISGNNTVFGIIYVMGTWDVQASPTIQGAVITRGPTSGNGTPVLVYDPDAFDSLGGNNSGTVVGSWRDW